VERYTSIQLLGIGKDSQVPKPSELLSGSPGGGEKGPLDGELSGYEMENMVENHSGDRVWRVTCFLNVKYLFCECRKRIDALLPLPKTKYLAPTQISKLYKWQSILLYIFELVLVLNKDEMRLMDFKQLINLSM
jgi:hypothetical protein